MKRMLFVFDIDGTICRAGRAVPPALASELKRLSGVHKVAIASGKPFTYITGLCRQLEITSASVIGENGGALSLDACFPPAGFRLAEIPAEHGNSIELIKAAYRKKFGERIWVQLNHLNVTFYPVCPGDIGLLHAFAPQFESDFISAYYHDDCMDFTPSNINKGAGLSTLLEMTGISQDNTWVFGDGENDFEMFRTAGNSVCVGSNAKLKEIADHCVRNIDSLSVFLERF
ncbi:HAD family phosphatase [Geovibrio thiophilus]|uniref:HAD family phosphatase n=1 Tax=Geovibrio thiophilus TaxID=139438 RepID=A0A410K0S3_9BACT|nr:HAD family hydrolase [Geovibrio thiophilus]QAR33941.1 HAD family phosphatase [Geovibrio thiophilus]